MSMRYTIAVPVFNEQESLQDFWTKMNSVLSDKDPATYEVIFIDDASTDESLSMLTTIAASHPNVAVYSLSQNTKKDAFYSIASREMNSDVLVTIDADLQDDPNSIFSLLDQLQPDTDICIGNRAQRSDRVFKKLTSRGMSILAQGVLRQKVQDTNASLKVMRKSVLQDIPLQRGLWRFIPYSAKFKGYRVVEIPIVHHARRAGTSKFGFLNRISTLRDLLHLKKLMNTNLVEGSAAEELPYLYSKVA